MTISDDGALTPQALIAHVPRGAVAVSVVIGPTLPTTAFELPGDQPASSTNAVAPGGLFQVTETVEPETDDDTPVGWLATVQRRRVAV